LQRSHDQQRYRGQYWYGAHPEFYKQGYLETTPGSSASCEYVAKYLRHVFDQHRVAKHGFDNWNVQFLLPWLLAAGFSE
jgi:hypothetical protein